MTPYANILLSIDRDVFESECIVASNCSVWVCLYAKFVGAPGSRYAISSNYQDASFFGSEVENNAK